MGRDLPRTERNHESTLPEDVSVGTVFMMVMVHYSLFDCSTFKRPPDYVVNIHCLNAIIVRSLLDLYGQVCRILSTLINAYLPRLQVGAAAPAEVIEHNIDTPTHHFMTIETTKKFVRS